MLLKRNEFLRAWPSLSFLPSNPCLFWWILSGNSCLLVFNSILRWKLCLCKVNTRADKAGASEQKGVMQWTGIKLCTTCQRDGECQGNLRKKSYDSLRSKRFQSSYRAKVRAEAKKGLKGEGRIRNACPQTPRFWKTPLDISRFGSFVNWQLVKIET